MATARSRRGRKVEADHRWESVAATIDIPCGVTLDRSMNVPGICGGEDSHRAGGRDGHRGRDAAASGSRDRAGTQTSMDGGGEGGGREDSAAGGGREKNDSAGGLRSTAEGEAEDEDECYPDNIEDFMATLLDGMRSDSVQLATSAKNVVQNTYQVCACGAMCCSTGGKWCHGVVDAHARCLQYRSDIRRNNCYVLTAALGAAILQGRSR